MNEHERGHIFEYVSSHVKIYKKVYQLKRRSYQLNGRIAT